MEKYIIYCTDEQTKKALELGAPITKQLCKGGIFDGGIVILGYEFVDDILPEKGERLLNPTAEQMRGWLECQGGIKVIAINNSKNLDWSFHITTKDNEVFASIGYKSRKEATLAAIDAALEYLINNKK